MAAVMQRPLVHASSGAACFEHHVASPFTSPECRALLRAAQIERGQRVLDLAAGTGVVARAAARHLGDSGRVVAMDSSGSLLGFGRQIALSDPATAEIVFRKGSPESLPFEDEAFDAVLYQQGLRPPLVSPLVLTEIRRVLRPGGRIACALLRDLRFSPFHYAVAQAIQRYGAARVAAGMSAPFLMDDGERMWQALEGLEFREVGTENRILRVRYTTALEANVRGCFRALHFEDWYDRLPPDERQGLIHRIARALQGYRGADGYTVPAGYCLIRAGKPMRTPAVFPSLHTRLRHATGDSRQAAADPRPPLPAAARLASRPDHPRQCPGVAPVAALLTEEVHDAGERQAGDAGMRDRHHRRRRFGLVRRHAAATRRSR